MSSKLSILPLGGLGEIGKNMTVIELDGKIVVVDTGLMFPTAEMLGIDLVLPDFTYLRDRLDDIEAIVLTHGHEDHVGALPYVLREIGIPPAIYGGRLTIGMVRSKIEEHKLRDVPLRDLNPGKIEKAGRFGIEMIHMSHSIPDACAVAIHTDVGKILLTGDYKFDQTPVDGVPADFARLAQLGAEGLLCLCGDSTNADRPGVATSESSVGPALLETFSRAEGRIIVTCFASNVHRVQQVVDAADKLGRKVALVGRSMRKNFNIASNLGLAHAPDGILIQPREIEDYPDEKVIAISTGSQGEPLSALRRMAHGDHRDVELHSGDTVVFSATPVPGNERSVNETVDRIFEIGARVITAQDAPIHASGHGYQEDMKLMLNLTKPKYVMPMHGDYKRLRLHAGLAESVGHPEGAHLPVPEWRPARVHRRQGPARQGRRRGDDLRRRPRARRARRCCASRSPDALGRRRRDRRGHGVVRGLRGRRRSRDRIPRRSLPRRRGLRAPARRSRRCRRGCRRACAQEQGSRARHDPQGRPRRRREDDRQAPAPPADGAARCRRGLGDRR